MAYRIVVLGDSVTWGQGLLDADKMHRVVASRIPQAEIAAVLAHSGAIIGVCGRQTKAPVDGEVPTSFPSILQQCEAFADDPASVDLVIVNGGINDIDVRYVLSPLTETADLRDAIERCCFCDMRELLLRVAAKFSKPTARIVVTSYYLILSDQSRFGLRNEFLLTMGVPIASLATLFPAAGIPVWGKVLENCSVFFDDSSDALGRAVAAAGDARVRFAAPPFTAANAALAADPWLFGVRWDLSPQDPVAAARREACTRHEPDLLRREQCFRASAGHPNVAGAQRYADAIIAALA